MAGKSLYATLEIDSNASQDDIKKAYRKLARKYHPDINKTKEAEEKFKEINSAYEVLNDPQKRSQYDRFGDSMFGNQSFQDFARSQDANVDLNDILNSIFGGNFAGFGGGGFSKNFSGGFSSGFGNSNFGGSSFTSGFNQPDLDIQRSIEIEFKESCLGIKKSLSINGDTFSINIPAGIKHGEKLRVKNKGNISGNQRGDLFLVVNVKSLPDFERDGDDLIQSFNVSLKTALFGGKIEVKTLRKNVTLKIPAGIKFGQKFKLKQEGVQNTKTKQMGDLYLKANIIIPDLSKIDKKLQEQMLKHFPD